MARRDNTPQRSFSGGEKSPNLVARADLPDWKSSAAAIENFVILTAGGLTRRSGFRDVNGALDASKLIPFAFSADDGYAIEATAGKFRFYRDFGFLLGGDGNIYELPNPFSADEINALRFAQSANELFLTTGARPMQALTRVDAQNWTIADAPLRNGPFMDANEDDTQSLYTEFDDEMPKGTAFVLKKFGNPIFQAGHVGSLWLIRERDGSEYGRWAAQSDNFFVGNFCRWVDNVYKCDGANDDKSGNQPPIHLFGSQWDGVITTGDSDARRWLYLHSGYGVVKITGFTDPNTVTVEAQSYVPRELHGTVAGDVLTGGTWRWAEGAFSDVRGWPRLAQIHKTRLYLVSTTAQETTLWASVIDDYTNFEANSGLATDGFTVTLEADTGRVNIPQWLVSGKRMGIGTSGDEHVLDSATPGETVKPDTVEVVPATSEGSASVDAIKIDGPVFISKDGRRIHALTYDFSSDSFVAPQLNLLADHMAGDNGGQFLGLAWQRDPYRLLYALRSDGTLAACTYRDDQNIRAWHRHPSIKGSFKSICCVPSPSGIRQDLWAIVERACAGGTVRRVECLMPFFELGDHDVTNAFFVDGGVFYNGAPATHIAGIPPHLNGETIDILADGKIVRGITIANGAVDLPFAASRAAIGLGLTALYTSLRLDREVYGALNGNLMNCASITVDVLRGAAIEAASIGNQFSLLVPSAGGVMDAPSALKTDILKIDGIPADWSDEGTFSVRCTSPLPATIRAITPNMQVST